MQVKNSSISIKESVIIAVFWSVARKVKHSMYFCYIFLILKLLATAHPSNLKKKRKKKKEYFKPVLCKLNLKSLFSPQRTQSRATHFLSSIYISSSLLTNGSSLPICFFQLFCSFFHIVFLFHLCFFPPSFLPVSFCVIQVISPPGANLAVIDPLISSALECQRNKP